MQNVIIHCQSQLLETVQRLGLDYVNNCTEIDVTIPYTKDVESINNSTLDDEEFVNHFGLDYNQINCIELI